MPTRCVLACSLFLLGASAAQAQGFLGADGGKLLLTAGFSTLEGSGGGALTPWAFITGYGSRNSWGANAHATGLKLHDVDLLSYGLAVGALDRFEVSISRQEAQVTGTNLDGIDLSQDIYGFKLRLFGDAVYSQDSWLPQVAVGAQFKRHGGIENAAAAGFPGLTNVEQLGAEDDEGIDYYLSATKLYLAHNLLVNATLRYTEANQFGLLGFGGDREADPAVRVEASVAYLIRRQLAIGGEYRARTANLTVDDEADAWDAFVAWTPTRTVSVVLAYANIGPLLTPVTGSDADQDGAYLSVQVGF
jgi:DUF3034 family protein